MEDPPTLKIRGDQIQVSDTEKLLGVHVDNYLRPGHLMLSQL